MESDSDLECTPPDLKKAAQRASISILPQKSQQKYLKEYENFKAWCNSKGASKVTENVVLAYFEEHSQKKASTLWAKHSMLKSTLALKENLDISKFFKVRAYLKRQNSSHTAKKASVFLTDEIKTFLTTAPDEVYLSTKVIVSLVR